MTHTVIQLLRSILVTNRSTPIKVRTMQTNIRVIFDFGTVSSKQHMHACNKHRKNVPYKDRALVLQAMQLYPTATSLAIPAKCL